MCKITDICCSEDGVVFIADQALKNIYRVELLTGNCYSFGKKFLAQPEGVVIWKEFVWILDSDCLLLFTPMGIFVKRFPLKISNPKAINIVQDMILITGMSGELHLFRINITLV